MSSAAVLVGFRRTVTSGRLLNDGKTAQRVPARGHTELSLIRSK